MSAASSAAPPSFQEVARHGASSSRSNGTRTSGSGSGSGRSSLRTASMGPTAGAHLSSGLPVPLCHQSQNFGAFQSLSSCCHPHVIFATDAGTKLFVII